MQEMCSRYFIREENGGCLDVRPRDEAAVWIREKEGLIRRKMRWGFVMPDGKSVVFNARSESAGEKSMFRDSLAGRRCVVPAAGFYEWNRAGEKAVFEQAGGGALYFAGCYRWQEGQLCFVILTTDANESMKSVHDRMPLILNRDEAAVWLKTGEEYRRLLGIVPARLKRTMDFEQQTFDFL